MDRHKANAAQQAAWRATSERPPCPQWHLLGLAVRGALAGSAGGVWPIHHLLQPLRTLATAGVWSRIIDALAAAHDASVQMIDTPSSA
jgi:hypothetical protein